MVARAVDKKVEFIIVFSDGVVQIQSNAAFFTGDPLGVVIIHSKITYDRW